MCKPAITTKALKTKYITTAFLFSFLSLVVAVNISAQEIKKERGYKGSITEEELLFKFKNSEFVEGYVIEGNDVIKIIKNTDYAIKIKNSVIKGGLNFTKLPKVHLSKEKLPTDWNNKKKEMFIKEIQSLGETFIYKVKNKIEITDSEIQSMNKSDHSVHAYNTFFYDAVNFSKTTFSGAAHFLMAAFNEETDFSGVTFSGAALITNTTFNGETQFINTTFKEETSFSMTTFSGAAQFIGATFKEETDFSIATFSESVNFSITTFNGETQFIGTAFKEETCFSMTTFNGEVDFSKTSFNGEAIFLKAAFKEETNFSEAIFNSKVVFSDTIFNKFVLFKKTRFGDALQIGSTTFKKYADLRETQIRRLDYKNTIQNVVEGRVDFRNATISEAHFQNIVFEKDIDFSDVKFGIPLKNEKIEGNLAVVFRYVTFESDVYFIRTEFHSDTAFERIKFKGDTNFTDIAFKDFKRGDAKKFSLSYLTFKHLLLSLDDLPDIQHWVWDDEDRIRSFMDADEDNMAKPTGGDNLQPLTKVLNNLEEVFHSQNNLSDANKAYYYRKLMELEDTRLLKFEDTSKKITFWQRVWNEVEWIFWGIPCGYATSWKKIVSWCGGFYLFFVILYSTGGKLTKTYQEKEDEFRLRLFVLPIKYLFHESEVDFVPNEYVIDHKEGWEKFISALKFSMVIFFKIGYIDTKISGKILRIDAKYFVWAEWVIGYWLLASLVVTLSNTLPIVHRLISGIF